MAVAAAAAAAAALFKWQVHARRRLVCPLKANSSKLLAVSSKQCQHARNMGPDPDPDYEPDPQSVAVVILFLAWGLCPCYGHP